MYSSFGTKQSSRQFGLWMWSVERERADSLTSNAFLEGKREMEGDSALKGEDEQSKQHYGPTYLSI